MDSRSLMIGDWVYDKVLKSYARVEALQPLTIKCDIHTQKHIYDEFEPIPLTPEILEKNGFTRTKLGYFDKKIKCLCGYYYAYVQIENNTIGCGEMYCAPEDVTECQWENEIYIPSGKIYVHTLQHALRLCGLEELATNFKI